MYVIKENAIVPVHVKEVLRLGVITDARVSSVELIVAQHYGVSTYDLDTFYKDSPAKIMCCFLLHDVLNYSIPSIAKRYKIAAGFLKINITGHYQQCLIDEAFFKLITSLKNAFFSITEKPNVPVMH